MKNYFTLAFVSALALGSIATALLPNQTFADTTSCTTVPSSTSTTRYQMQNYFTVSFTRTGTTGTATVKRIGTAPLCSDQQMVLESFSMSPNWNGGGDTHDSFVSSLPQTMSKATHFTFGKDETSKTVTVATPEACKGTQLDVYVGDAEVSKIVNEADGENREIGGKIFQATGTCETPVVEVKKVSVCDATNRTLKEVAETDASKYDKADSDKCATEKVCVVKSGDTTLKPIYKDQLSDKYSTDTSKCEKPETPVVTTKPEEPAKPLAATTQKDEPVIAKTGPEAVLGGLFGTGALGYGAYAYYASRKAVRSAFLR